MRGRGAAVEGGASAVEGGAAVDLTWKSENSFLCSPPAILAVRFGGAEGESGLSRNARRDWPPSQPFLSESSRRLGKSQKLSYNANELCMLSSTRVAARTRRRPLKPFPAHLATADPPPPCSRWPAPRYSRARTAYCRLRREYPHPAASCPSGTVVAPFGARVLAWPKRTAHAKQTASPSRMA